MSVDPRDIDAWCDAATLRLSPRDVAVKRLPEEVCARCHGAATAAEPATSPTFRDALALGATSIADVEKLVEELLTARDYLQSEGERVLQLNARYSRMAKSASASVNFIAESLEKWRSLAAVDQAPVMTRRARTLPPVHDGGFQREADDQ
jgi:hypothetical protein